MEYSGRAAVDGEGCCVPCCVLCGQVGVGLPDAKITGPKPQQRSTDRPALNRGVARAMIPGSDSGDTFAPVPIRSSWILLLLADFLQLAV